MFCVGATKAGTSWLYDYLHQHDECALKGIKELHYFDSLDLGADGFTLKGLARTSERLAAKASGATGDERERLTKRLKEIETLSALIGAGEENVDGYLAFLRDGAVGAKLVGDLTPAYALLSEERLAQMARLSDDVRVVFVMRDPLDRLWSHVRMNAKRQLKPGQEIEQKARNILNLAVRKGEAKDITDRGDYAVILEKLTKAVPADRLFVTFFERLVTPEGVAELCEFLGISHRTADTGKRVHEGISLAMNDGQKKAAQDFLAPQYAYVEKTFGTLPARWHANWRRV